MAFTFLQIPKKSITNNMTNIFSEIASELINNVCLIANKKRYRFIEIEFYLLCPEHPDLFTHGDLLQKSLGRWYFHRKGNNYKSGTFKGLDITFGMENIFAGILIRSLKDENGIVINGPCLCVESILKDTAKNHIGQLDQQIGEKKVWDSSSPLYLKKIPKEDSPIIKTARVGLSLKQKENIHQYEQYIGSSYRFLTSPSIIKKGKIYTVLALYIAGKSIQEIYEITQTPIKYIKEYITYFNEGKTKQDFIEYYGKDMNSKYLSQIHGTWQEKFENN